MDDKKTPMRPKISRNLLLFFFISIACALCLEGVFDIRKFVSEEALNRNYIPYYPWSFNTIDGRRIGRSGYLKLALHPFACYFNLPDQKHEHFNVNHFGFRGKSVNRDKGNRKRIILVGGSTAFGTGLKDDSETFANQLEARLPGVEVVNAARRSFYG